MLDLVNNILDMSRIESGRTELNNHAFCLRDVFKDVVLSIEITSVNYFLLLIC
jgi:signal transduction histidine kinase